MVFGGAVGVNEGRYLSFQFQKKKKEGEIVFANFFLLDLPNLKRQPIQFITNLGLLSF